jgi:hypothetical protein
MAKRWTVPMVVVLVLVGLVAFGRPGPARAAPAADRLPDLGMAPLTDLSIDTTTIPGRRLLRFTTVIVNVGQGPFETIGSRPDTGIAWIDITGLKSGRYRLTATADPGGWFVEANDANNATWLNLKLTGAGVSVLSRGPAPERVGSGQR